METIADYAKRLDEAFKKQDREKKKRISSREEFVINLETTVPVLHDKNVLFFNKIVLAHDATFARALVKASREHKDGQVEVIFMTEFVKVELTIPVRLFSGFDTAGFSVPTLPAGTLITARYYAPNGIGNAEDFSVSLALTFY